MVTIYNIKKSEMINHPNGEVFYLLELRGLSSHYLKGFSDTKRYRVKFTTMNSEKEFLQICDEIVKNYQENLLINY